jgi:hypothetical protein
MELEAVLYGSIILILGFAALKTYSSTEVQKQERLCEERERKASIYAKRDYDIARAEANIYSTGFDTSEPQSTLDMSSITSLMSNPEIAKLAEQFLKPKT